jgi:hypothetical protein
MQGGFGINMLAGMDWVRGPASGDGILHLLSRVVVPADELEPVDDLDRVELLPDVIPELGKISQECRNEIRITKICDVCQLVLFCETFHVKKYISIITDIFRFLNVKNNFLILFYIFLAG